MQWMQEHRQVLVVFSLDEILVDKMGDHKRAFFEAHVYAIDDQGGFSIVLGKRLPEQGW